MDFFLVFLICMLVGGTIAGLIYLMSLLIGFWVVPLAAATIGCFDVYSE
jgi:hypothetical protein